MPKIALKGQLKRTLDKLLLAQQTFCLRKLTKSAKSAQVHQNVFTRFGVLRMSILESFPLDKLLPSLPPIGL